MKNQMRKIFGSNHRTKNSLFTTIVIVLGLIISISFTWTPVSFAQDNPPVIREIRVMGADRTGINQPMGLVFSSRLNAFYALDAREWRRSPTVTNLIALTVFEDRAGSARIEAAIQDPINMVYDNKANRLLILQAQGNQLLEVLADQNGKLDPATLTRHNVVYFGLQNPQGLTVDPVSGDLLILDAAGPRIVRISGNLDSGTVSVVDLGSSGISMPRGIALDPSTGHLHVVSQSEQKLFELTQSGETVAVRDLAQFGLKNPQEIVFAPSSDQTDDSSQFNLFLADSGQNDVQATSDSQGTGQIVELSLTEPVAAAAATFVSSIVNMTDLSKVSPPSPDPSGLTYWPSRNSLVMSDGEVEETVNNITHWQGANVWELSLGGQVKRTADISRRFSKVVPMTDEPTGVAWNPNDGHFYFTDDGMKEVFDLNPGADGWIGTADDTWTHFDTLSSGNGDTEGITYDTWNNRLFVADGVNREVYQYTLNGTLVNHFDVAKYGVEDPETVEFNPDTGTLFVMSSNRTSLIIVETTLSGNLLQTIDISATNAKQAAALAYAPASNNSGVKRFYVVDRGIDNNSDPKIIDGKMYEMTTPSSTPSTPPPTNTPGPSPTPTNTPPVTDNIFADGFETGNLSAWSSSVIDAGDLSVSAAAALVGSRGLQAVIDDNNSIYVVDDHPTAEPRYRARFYFDPNSISMVSGDTTNLFFGYAGTSTAVLRCSFRFSSGAYQIRCSLINDSGTWLNTSWFTISDATHWIELDWRAATAAGANDGGLKLWIDGVDEGTPTANLTGVDNDTRRIDRVRFGAASGIDTGTRGTYYFDAFESRRQSYIGP